MTGQSITRWQTHKLVSGNLILISIAGEDVGLDESHGTNYVKDLTNTAIHDCRSHAQ